MGIQTITGVVKDANGDAWADAVVEMAFSDGHVPAGNLDVTTRTKADGTFSVDVDNNAAATKAIVLRLPDGSTFTADLDPEETDDVAVGDLMAYGSGSRTERLAAATASVDEQPKSAPTLIKPGDKAYLLQSDVAITGTDPALDLNHVYTYRGQHGGRDFWRRADDVEGSPTEQAISFSDGDSLWHIYASGVMFSAAGAADTPWEVESWDVAEFGTLPLPTVTEKPTVKRITIEELADAIDAILNP